MSKKIYLGSELIATNSMLENAIDKIDSRIDDEVSAVNERIDTEVEALRAVDAGLQGEIDELAEEIPTPAIEDAGKAIVVNENGEYTLREAGVPQELIDRVDALENETAALSEEKLNAPELVGNAGKIIIVSEDENAAEVSEYAVADIIDYADSVAAQEAQAAEQRAKDYADSKASAAEQSAKNYTDSKASAAEQSAKDYADSVANDAKEAAKSYAHSEDVALKEVIDEKFKTDAFIICNTDVEVNELLVVENIGKHIKFMGSTSNNYEKGSFYQIIEGRKSALNNWGVINDAFEAERSRLQINAATELVRDVLSKGEIDIDQTIALTTPAKADMAWGDSSTSNPQVPSASWSQGQPAGTKNAYHQTDSTFIVKNVTEELDTVIKASTYYGLRRKEIADERALNSEAIARLSDKEGVIYGFALNGTDYVDPSIAAHESLTFEQRTSKIYGTHTIKVPIAATSVEIKCTIDLFGNLLCNPYHESGGLGGVNKWTEDGLTTGTCYGSMWAKYETASGIQYTKLGERSLFLETDKPQAGDGANDQNHIKEVFRLADSYEVYSSCKFLDDILADNSGYRNIDIIEVVEAYKPQGYKDESSWGTIIYPVNNVDIFAWAAFTDFKILTIAGTEIVQPYANNPGMFLEAELSNSLDTRVFTDLESSLKGAYLASVDMNINLDNGDRFIWKGLAVANGASYTVYTENDNRETLNISINSDGAIVVDGITPAAGQSITVKRLL